MMKHAIHLEHRPSSSRGKHEGEPSFALCDRLSRTRDLSQRQLPTDHDHAVPTREYQTDQSSLTLPRLRLALSSNWLTLFIRLRCFCFSFAGKFLLLLLLLFCRLCRHGLAGGFRLYADRPEEAQ